jgi:hypothetical protein
MLVAALWGAAALLAWHTERANEQLWQLEHRRSEAAQRAAAAAQAPAQTRSQAEPAYAESAAQMLKERSLVWPEVLLALERAALEGVTVGGVTAAAAEPHVLVQISARDHAQVIEDLQILNAAPRQPGVVWFELLRARAEPGGAVTANLSATRLR